MLTILELLDPKLEQLFKLHQQVQLIDALHELQLQEPELNTFLFPEYQYILNNGDELQAKFQKQPKALEALFGAMGYCVILLIGISGVLIDLYLTKYKLKGKSIEGKEGDLRIQLAHYSLENLKNFFSAPV